MGDRSSTRVRAPPGGSSSFSLGWDDSAAPTRRAAEPVPAAAAASIAPTVVEAPISSKVASGVTI